MMRMLLMMMLATGSAFLGRPPSHVSDYHKRFSPPSSPRKSLLPSARACLTSLYVSSTTTSEKGPVTFPEGFNRVEIEYCTGCRWMLRAAWLATELLTTFQEDLEEVAIQPARVSGTFDIRINGVKIWDRRAEGRFPEAKEVKQRLRDVINPEKDLGHSDVAQIIKEANNEGKGRQRNEIG